MFKSLCAKKSVRWKQCYNCHDLEVDLRRWALQHSICVKSEFYTFCHCELECNVKHLIEQPGMGFYSCRFSIKSNVIIITIIILFNCYHEEGFGRKNGICFTFF